MKIVESLINEVSNLFNEYDIDGYVIENENFKKPEIQNIEPDIRFIEENTNFSRKQLTNRLNRIFM